MRRLFVLPLLGALAILALPGSAFAAHGSDCGYATTGGETEVGSNDVDGNAANGNQQVFVYGGSEGLSGQADVTAGGCVNFDGAVVVGGNRFDGGTGEAGSDPTDGEAYAVIDGDNDNTDPQGQSDGYIGISNFETGATRDPVTKATDCLTGGPDTGEPGTTNSGGCIGPDGGPVWVPIPVAPSPMCGNTSGNTWDATSRDGCSIP